MFGVRLTLDARDPPMLALLARAAPALVNAPWERRQHAGGCALFTALLDEDAAEELKLRGIAVVRDDAFAPPPGEPVRIRAAQNLLEALPLARLTDAEAASGVERTLFVVPLRHAAATTLLERLALLGRDDARLGEVDIAGERSLVVVVSRPPLYLLLRARDEPADGVRAFVERSAHLFLPFGFSHPLQGLLEARAAATGRTMLLDEGGAVITLAVAPAELAPLLTPILEALRPTQVPAATALAVEPTALSFTVRLTLIPADPRESELWLVDAERALVLEPLLATLSREDAGRVLLSRLGDDQGRAQYLLREVPRPDGVRIADRLDALLGRGFSRAPGLENLYLPPDRRLSPPLLRDHLKGLFSLADVACAILSDAGDGTPLCTSVRALDDQPLSALTQWIATDHRRELDRLFEEAVASFPRVKLPQPARAAPPVPAAPSAQRALVPPRRPPPRPRVAAGQTGLPPEERALFEQAHTLESEVLGDAVDDARRWRELGLVKDALDDGPDAAACLCVALFLSDAPHEVAADLVRVVRRAQPTLPADLLELAVRPKRSPDEATLLAALALAEGARGGPGAAAARSDAQNDTLTAAAEVLTDRELMVSRRLQWAALYALAQASGDRVLLVRAKELVLGALNARGLSELLDMPRFVRTALALGDSGPADPHAQRSEQAVLLERLLQVVVERPLEITDPHAAFLRAIFAVGLVRTGAPATALVASLRTELDAHDPPTRALLGLYLARASHFVSNGTIDVWQREVDDTLKALPRQEDQRVVEWLVKRSLWLAPPTTSTHSAPQTRVQQAVAEVAGRPARFAAAARAVLALPGVYDYDVAWGIDALVQAALSSGNDDVISDTAAVAEQALPHIRIAAHRMQVVAACVRVGALQQDGGRVERMIGAMVSMLGERSVPTVRELVQATRPALSALRKLGNVDAAGKLLDALTPLAEHHARDAAPLLAAAAEGFLFLGDGDRARALLDEALRRSFADATAYIDRYEGVAAVLGVLPHTEMDDRAVRAEFLLRSLSQLKDTFTTSGWYRTHQLLAAERIVEALVDDTTVRGDRLQAWLDAEEQRVRRRILDQTAFFMGTARGGAT